MSEDRTDSVGAGPQKPQRNPFAIAGLCLGIASVFFYTLGILPILAIVFSGIGLAKMSNYGGNGKIQAGVGLALGIIFCVMYLWAYGHIGDRRTSREPLKQVPATSREPLKQEAAEPQIPLFIQTKKGGPPTQWPPLSAAEANVIETIAKKATTSVLTHDDLENYKSVIRQYLLRNNIRLSALQGHEPREVFFGLAFNEYLLEHNRCMKLSYESVQPVISTELRDLAESVQTLGISSEAEIQTISQVHLSKLSSAAYQIPWTNHFGKKMPPIRTREIMGERSILDLRQNNLEKLRAVVNSMGNEDAPGVPRTSW